MLCAISGNSPVTPVVNKNSGNVYEKSLILKYIRDNEGKDPVSGEAITEEDLLEVKTAPSAPSIPPRPPQFTSIPSLLQALQNEWDSTQLEAYQLRSDAQKLRQDLSHSLYKEDAATRVLARVIKERDEAKAALSDLRATMGISAPAGDTEMETDAPAEQAAAGVPKDIQDRITSTSEALVPMRKKRKAPEGYATSENIAAYAQSTAIPSMHTTKPPGIACLDTTKDGQVTVTGGMDKNLQVYDRESGKLIATPKGHTKPVTAVAFVSADPGAQEAEAMPALIASASLDETVRLWSYAGPPPSKKKHEAYQAAATITSQSGAITGLSVHPSRSLIATSSVDGTWALHDVAEPTAPKTVLNISLPRENVQATSIAFHPDGMLLAVGCSDSTVLMFQVANGTVAHEFAGHTETGGGAINSLSFSENGYILASSTDQPGSTINVWDLRKAKMMTSIPAASAEAKTHRIAFDPSALYLSAAGASLRVWAYKSWDSPLLNFEDNTADLTGLSWAKNGSEIIVGGMDRSIRVLGAPAA